MENPYQAGGIPTPLEKYESQLGLLFPIYGKIKTMFQTTNQPKNTYQWKCLNPKH